MKKFMFRLFMTVAVVTALAVSALGTYSTWKLVLKEIPIKYSLGIAFDVGLGLAVGLFLACCFGYILVQLTDKVRIFIDRNFPADNTFRKRDEGAEWMKQNGGAENSKPARTSCPERPWRRQNHANRMHIKLGD